MMAIAVVSLFVFTWPAGIPAPGEPGDEAWGDVPFEERQHVGAWMVPS